MPTARHLLFVFAALLFASVLASPAVASPTDDARTAAEEQRWQDAAGAWMQVLEKSPANREAALGLATAVIEGGLIDPQVPAEDALHAVLDKTKDDREAHLALGDLFIAVARSKADPQAMKFVFEDAKLQFKTLLDARPNDEDAAVGLARTHYWMAYFSDALQVLDDFLAKNKSKGPALFWKGQIYYLQALDAYRAAGQIDDAARKLFQQAMGSYEAAATAAPETLDAWMQLGYANQYLGDLEAAQVAYEKALALDDENRMPLKGIAALYHYRPTEYLPALEALAEKYPGNHAVYFFLGRKLLSDEDFAGAVDRLGTYVKRSKAPGTAWHYLGKALDGAGQEDEAEEAFVKALKANPRDEASAFQLDRRLQQQHKGSAGASLSNAKAAIQAYEKLFELAPTAHSPRNNAAFILREAFARHANDPSWKPILDECVRLYVESSKLIEEKIDGREDTLGDPLLWNYAGVINDTGLMFQYYPSHEDLEKAEDYYIRALSLTGDGYADAFGNLFKIYEKQGRLQEAYELAHDCADSLRKADGSPHPAQGLARQEMERLARSGKVETD